MFVVAYFTAALADLLRLGTASLLADPENGEPCDYCRTPRTLLIPVVGPLRAASEHYSPLSKDLSIAVGVTQILGLAVTAIGVTWLLTSPPRRLRAAPGWTLSAVPLPSGAAIGFQLVL